MGRHRNVGAIAGSSQATPRVVALVGGQEDHGRLPLRGPDAEEIQRAGGSRSHDPHDGPGQLLQATQRCNGGAAAAPIEKRCLEVIRMDAPFQLEQPAVGRLSGEREAGEPTERPCPCQSGRTPEGRRHQPKLGLVGLGEEQADQGWAHFVDACGQKENEIGLQEAEGDESIAYGPAR